MWDFAIGGKTLRVYRGSGRWSATIDTETMRPGKGIYVYDGTYEDAECRREVVVTQQQLRVLRAGKATALGWERR